MLIPVGKLHAPVLAGVMNCYFTRGIAGGRTILNDVARQASLGLRPHQRNRTVQNKWNPAGRVDSCLHTGVKSAASGGFGVCLAWR